MQYRLGRISDGRPLALNFFQEDLGIDSRGGNDVGDGRRYSLVGFQRLSYKFMLAFLKREDRVKHQALLRSADLFAVQEPAETVARLAAKGGESRFIFTQDSEGALVSQLAGNIGNVDSHVMSLFADLEL